MIERNIGGKRVFLKQKGTAGPVIYWGTFLHRENEIEHLIESLEEYIPKSDYILVAFLAEDWNRDFSPWQAPPAFGENDFQGDGPKMLAWLVEECIPVINREFGSERPRFLVGYSLAGLFTLWAGYETDLFDGVASCSGSLWFRNWDSYAKSHSMSHPCKIYLSLGNKEEKTRNQQMAKVGDRTRTQAELLERDNQVVASVLEWNSGGHFADAGERLAKGIKWLMEN